MAAECNLPEPAWLRKATSGDHAALADICLRTGDAGGDASGLDHDATLLGAVYAVPYQIFAPDFAFVLEDVQGVCGYVLGTPDTCAFDQQLQREWYPTLRARVADPGPDKQHWRGFDWLRRKIHLDTPAFPAALLPYPAHGHIDLLPRVQGKGMGRKALDHLAVSLCAAGAPGLHLGVNPRNIAALRFYQAMGYHRLSDPDLPRDTVFMVRDLANVP